MRSVVNTLHELTERGITVRFLHDGVNTSTSTGRMIAGILTALSEYERELIRERTAPKLEHARRSGVEFRRPAKLNADQAALARRVKESGETTADNLQEHSPLGARRRSTWVSRNRDNRETYSQQPLS